MLLSVSYAIAAYFIVNAQFAPGNDVVYIWKRPVLGRETAARDSYDSSYRWQFHFKGGIPRAGALQTISEASEDSFRGSAGEGISRDRRPKTGVF
jgi:hypothetical protein